MEPQTKFSLGKLKLGDDKLRNYQEVKQGFMRHLIKNYEQMKE